MVGGHPNLTYLHHVVILPAPGSRISSLYDWLLKRMISGRGNEMHEQGAGDKWNAKTWGGRGTKKQPKQEGGRIKHTNTWENEQNLQTKLVKDRHKEIHIEVVPT